MSVNILRFFTVSKNLNIDDHYERKSVQQL